MIKELILPFFIGTFAVVMMFAANQLIFIFKTFPMATVPKIAVLQSLIYKLPFWLNMTLPVGTSLGASLAFSRLQRESELTAMRAAGARILRVVAPVAVFGLLVAIGNFLLVEKVMPQAEKRFNDLAIRIGIASAAPSFRARAVVYLDDFTATFGSVTRGSDDSLVLNDIMLFDTPSLTEQRYIDAKRGTYLNGEWTLDNCRVRLFNGDNVVSVSPYKDGQPMKIYQKIVIKDLFTGATPEEKTLGELRDDIAKGKKSGSDTTASEVKYYTRFSVPAACIVFALVGPIFAVMFSRSGAFVGVLLSIVLVMLYYNVYIISTEVLGNNAVVPAWLAAWLPNILFAGAGLIAIRRLE